MATTKTMRKTMATASTSDAVVEKLADAPIVESVVEKKTAVKKQKKSLFSKRWHYVYIYHNWRFAYDRY